MKPFQIEVVVNGVPAGTFSRFMWHRNGRYLLRLIRVDVSVKREIIGVAHYTYILEIEKHKGYTLVTVNMFGGSWLINFGRRLYVERLNKQEE